MEEPATELNIEESSKENHKKSLMFVAIILVTLIAIFLLIFGLKYFFKETDLSKTKYSYNGFIFNYGEDNLWHSSVMIKNLKILIRLQYGPKELENISVSGKLGAVFSDPSSLYITFDPEASSMNTVALSMSELSANLVQGLGIRTIGACTKNATDCVERPILTCNSTTSPVIFLNSASVPSSVVYEDNCIIVSGTDKELVKATERLIYQWYGIMN